MTLQEGGRNKKQYFFMINIPLIYKTKQLNMARVKLRLFIVPVLVMMLLIDGFMVEAQPFAFESWSNANTPVMTVGGFQSVAVDKRGKVWAGSSLGGLYCYRDNQWVKIGTYPDITFRHIVPSNMPLDSNAWASSIGKTGVQAISGGAYHINTKLESVTQYGSGIAGGLSSRFGNSLLLSSEGKVYVALGQSTTGGVTSQGGVFKAFTVNPPVQSSSSFIKAIVDVGDIAYTSAGNRGEELWFGRGANCQSGCKAPYIAQLTASGETLGRITAENSPLPFVASGSSPFARAIFTDSVTGNTFVGLNSGGVGVMKPNRTWKLLTSDNSPFPAGAAVNFNAITEVYGEIWIGTTLGMFIYNGRGSFESASSFKLLTTADGLPGNSITDIAVDTAGKFLWVTTPFGVSRSPYMPTNIRGRVFNVSMLDKLVPDSTPILYPALNKIPLENVNVKLLENDQIIEWKITDRDGFYEFTKAIDGKTYSIEVEYLIGSNDIKKFVYPNIKNRPVMESVLIPDKLISEVKAFKKSMSERRFPLDLVYFIKPKYSWKGFDVSNYETSFEQFLNPLGIKDLHRKRVDNLANFYCAAGTVYNLGGTSRSLIDESVGKAIDLVETLTDFISILSPIKKEVPRVGDAIFAFSDCFVELAKNAFDRAILLSTADDQTKKLLEKIFKNFSYAMDFANLNLKEDLNKGKEDFLKGVVKRTFSYAIAGLYYQEYCTARHQDFVTEGASGSMLAKSGNSYEIVFQKLYGPNTGSFISQSDNIEKTAKIKIISSNEKAALADFAKTTADIASKVSVLTPAAWLAPLLKGAAVTANIIKAGYIADAMLESAGAALKIGDLSSNVLASTGLKTAKPTVPITLNAVRSPRPLQSITTLIAAKSSYHQSLENLKVVYNAPAYDSDNYFSGFNLMAKADSVYNSELKRSLNTLWSSADSATILIPGFTQILNHVIDSFVSQQYSRRIGFMYNNFAYMFDTDKGSYKTDLTRMADSIMLLNDSTVLGISRLIDSVALKGIISRANLVQVSHNLNHSRKIGDAGSFTYSLTNFGGEAQTNVSFKINKPTTGYKITSADSIYVGTIPPGNTVEINYFFEAPQNDSLSNYEISVKADNGIYRNISGALFSYDPAKFYSVRDGNWSNPNVWINGVVPAASSVVEVNHNILVDVDANCKTLRTIYPANLSVTPGKKLNITGN